MKKFPAAAATLLFLSTLISTAAATGAGTLAYANTQHIANNLTYTNTVTYVNDSAREESYALCLNGSGDAYPIIMADDTIYGSLTIDQMISYAQQQGYNVLAAVNTDFFSMQTGVPLGLVVENGVYKSSPEGHTAVAFKETGGVYFSKGSEVTISLTNRGSSTDSANNGKTVSLTHFNKYRMDTGGLYLFSSAFSTVSTRTSTPGWFVKFKILSGRPSVSGTMTLEVAGTVQSSEAQTIGDDYLVLTAADQCGYDDTYTKFKVGDQVTLTTACTDEKLNDAKWVTGGGDILIQDGVVTDSANWDKDISNRNPRTAFGVKADGTIVSYVADGDEAGHATGLTIKELAEEMLQRGCVSAINFDGGGSSAMSVKLPGTSSCAVVNEPSDGTPRKCAEYMLFVTNKTSDGKAKYLSVLNDGPVVLAGSSVTLNYGAEDGGYAPVTVPSDVAAVSGGLGSISGTTYKAGAIHGVDPVTLTSSTTGATGAGTIHIIYDPTDIILMAADTGKAVTEIKLWPGDSYQFSSAAYYCGIPVNADRSAYKYTTTGDVGTITAEGLFTAGKEAGVSGTIDLTVGGTKQSVRVSVIGFSDVTNHWAYQYIRDLSGRNIVTGTTAATYTPDANIRRGDFVLMLYRAAGQPTIKTQSSFKDVAVNDYYANAIAWAEANKIATGNGNGQFNPTESLTREQAFTFLYRALGTLNVTAKDGSAASLSGFKDKIAVASYAVTPTATLVELGIVAGADGKLNPAGNISRAEMAKILSVSISKAN